MKRFDISSFPALFEKMRRPYQANYYSMYSSVYGGIVTDPVLMQLPIDDHMVHRGDGIFEVFKCVNGRIYNLEAHLRRMKRAAGVLNHKFPCPPGRLKQIVIDTIRAGGHNDCYIHLYISRGPGSFSVNPYECPESQLYVVCVKLKKPFMAEHPKGARVASSSIPIKPPFYAEVKSCNYLPNALMKKESVDLKVDFVVGFDDRGFLGEGASENVGIVTQRRELLFPKLDGVLSGTTMRRVVELARRLIRSRDLLRVGYADIPKRDVFQATEILIVGTTPNVTAVREFDGRVIGSGKPGPIFRKISRLLLTDIHKNTRMQTPVQG